MKLENQFFHSFFYPFLIGVLLSATTIIVSSRIFTNNYIDRITGINLLELGKEYSKININSINELINSILLKVQISLNEIILHYQHTANLIKSQSLNMNRYIDDNYLIGVLDLNETFDENNENTYYMAYWHLDSETNLAKLKPNSFEKNQLITISNIMKNIFSTFYSTNSTSRTFYFYFEST